jgi:drug/metabolite transporter (DMT)-like permease
VKKIFDFIEKLLLNLKTPHKGMLLALLSSFIFAVRLCIIKLTPLQKIETFLFYRFFFDFLVLAPFFLKNPQNLITKNIRHYIGRSFLVIISIYCSTHGIKHLALGDAVLLQYTYPLFIALLTYLFFKNRISLMASWALVVGFSSLFFLIKPKLDIIHFASFTSLGAAIAAAILAISLQRSVHLEPISTILFYCTLFSGVISSIPYGLTMEPVSLPVIAIYLLPSSLLGVAYQFLIAKAYFFTPAHVVGSFSYSCVFFSAFFGWLIWDETMEGAKLIGTALVVLCCLLMVYENHSQMAKNAP